jgi:hypothetical protein
MGFLVLLFIGIAFIIVIAKLASKMRPESERVLDDPDKETQMEVLEQDLDEDDPKEILDALIAILTRKEILNPDELLIELSAHRKSGSKDTH